jgi:isoaspartyl peptidase/L-asparaginase-like protein (Ntn-hydrolase superfamily)
MRILALLLVAFAAGGCKSKDTDESRGEAPAPAPAVDDAKPAPAAAIAHGGVSSPLSRVDGCRAAVDAALAALEAGGAPVDAAVAGVKVMEDDPRFNAGTGSRVRLDGATVQMDAAVMTSAGEFGAVAVIEHVRHPIDVARAVMDTPHLVIAADGATRFARTLGIEPYDPATDEMKAKTAAIVAKLRANDPSVDDAWRGFDWRAHWNFEATLKQLGLEAEAGTDTVGVAVRGADGSFGVALSTGGTAITLRGRVGDVPILGAGLFAGADGAVAATGTGERIVEASLSRRVHDWLAEGVDAAARRGVAEIGDKGSIGLIVIGRRAMTAAADREMAWAARELGSDRWEGPAPR